MENNKSFLLTIQTPKETIFSGNVYKLTIRTESGYMGLLPNHIPILANLKEGNFSFNPSDLNVIQGHISSGILFFQYNEAIILSSDIVLEAKKDFNVFEVPEFKKEAN